MVLRKAVERRPRAAELRGDLGLAYMRTGQLAEGQRELMTALRLRPDSPRAHNSRAAAQDSLMRLAQVEARP